MSQNAVYPGSFDPITNGHIHLIERGLKLFERVTVAMATNIKKTPLFEFEQRAAFIDQVFEGRPVVVQQFDGLLVEFMRQENTTTVLRGLRNATDYEFELQMAHMNRHLASEVETVFLMADPAYAHISSSLIKEVARFGGSVDAFVPRIVGEALRRKYSQTEDKS